MLIPAAIATPSMGALRLASAKLPGTPPAVVFAIVWPILYALIGVAVVLLATRPATSCTPAVQWTALGLLLAQLAVNWAWTPVFVSKNKLGATVMVLVMLMATGTATALCTRAQVVSAALLAPYFVWLIYALLLSSSAFAQQAAGGSEATL